jgi:hypothetical protein
MLPCVLSVGRLSLVVGLHLIACLLCLFKNRVVAGCCPGTPVCGSGKEWDYQAGLWSGGWGNPVLS